MKKNNNNNNTKDDVYGAVTAIARVHPVHLMNAEQRQVAADLRTKPVGLKQIRL